MGKKIQCWIDESLEQELRKIQEKMRKQIGDVDLSKPQASIIAAKMLKDKPVRINAEVIKSKRGKRINYMNLL